MSRPYEKASTLGAVGAAAVSLVLSAAITTSFIAGLVGAPVRLPSAVVSAYYQRLASADRVASQAAPDVLIDSPRQQG